MYYFPDMHCSVPARFFAQVECSPLSLVIKQLLMVQCQRYKYTLPLCLNLMYTDVQITPTTADIISADTAQIVPYTV